MSTKRLVTEATKKLLESSWLEHEILVKSIR
jgi:hypothetical protein